MKKILLLLTGWFMFNTLAAQVVVDGKDVSTDTEIHYIQLLYYIDKGKFRPVYVVDYGLTDSQKGVPEKQKLTIDGVEIKDSMSPVTVINKLYKSGWRYMGDQMYVQVPMVENWYSYTFERREPQRTK